jgi:tetratricopeptide (TPR) repeat protein
MTRLFLCLALASGVSRAQEARSVVEAGLAALERGQAAGAVERLQAAAALAARAGDVELEIVARNYIGAARFYQGRYADAELAYSQALALASRGGEPWRRRRRALTSINLGVLYEQLGDGERALASYREAGAASDLEPADEAQRLATLGALYRRLRRPDEALAAWAEAVRRFQAARDALGAIETLHQAGALKAVDQRDAAAARADFERALALAAADRRLQARCRLMLAQALDSREEFQAALTLARAEGAVEEQWTALVGLARIDARAGRTAEALALAREAVGALESVRFGWRKPSLQPGYLPARRDAYDLAISLELDRGAAPADLLPLIDAARGRFFPDALREASGRPTLAAIQAKLGEDALLVEYWIGDERGAALWVARSAAGVVRFPFPAADAALAGARPIDGDWGPWSRALGRRLLSGLPLAGARAILVVPDAPLRRVPFDALDAGAGLLIRRAEVSYLPAAALLLRPARPSSLRPPWSVQLVGIGETPAAAAAALPGRALLRDGRKSQLAAPETAAAPLLFLAAPVHVDREDANRSRIDFPLDAGRLYWAELISLQLPAAELVAQLAPRPGPTREFSRAWLAAGAASTLTTFWTPPEDAAAELLRRFCGALGRGRSRAAALRDAKLALLDSSAHGRPSGWAAFALEGETGKLTPVAPWWLLACAVAAAVALAALLLRRQFRK